jgi:large subunit ribosomal protein L22
MTQASSQPASVQQARAEAKYVRMTARKVRLVVDAIRGKMVADAEDLLKFIPRGAATPVAKVLKSAKSNATNNHDMLEDQLFVKAAFVNEGPTLKRILTRARGRGDYMMKRTSHITIVLEEKPVERRAPRKVAGKATGKAEAKPTTKPARQKKAVKEATDGQ